MIQSWSPTVVDNVDYPASDGQPVGETPRHINNLFYVTYTLGQWFASNPSVFVAGNMFVYYERGNNRRHVSPDVFVSLDIPKETVPPRERYLLWEEGKGLDTVIEFTSPSTADEDLTTKRGIYRDILQVREYFLFDPIGETLAPPLQGLRLVDGTYQPIEPMEGRLPSAVLGLHLEADGDILRLWNPLTGDWLPIPPESSQLIQEAKTASQEAEAARQEAVTARQEVEIALQQTAGKYAIEQEVRRQVEVALAAERAAKEQAQALRIQEEKARKKEARARKKEAQARKKEAQARKQAEEARKQAEEARKQAEEGLRHKDAELEQLKREIEDFGVESRRNSNSRSLMKHAGSRIAFAGHHKPGWEGVQPMIQPWTPTVVDHTEYPASDGKPLGETPRHIDNLLNVTFPLREWFAGNPSAFVAACMFVYYEQGNNRRNVTPDVFVSLAIPRETVPPRERYLLWKEGKGLDTVIELTSPSTVDEDLITKRNIYRDILQVREYFLFDPTGETLEPRLQGLRLVDGDYQAIQPVDARLPSAVLGLHLETDGDLLRLWNPVTGLWLLIPSEYSQLIQAYEAARQASETACQATETARQAIESARQQSEVEYTLHQEARRQIAAALAAERVAKEAKASRIREEQALEKAEQARQKAEERLRQKDAELEQLKRTFEGLRRGKQKEQ